MKTKIWLAAVALSMSLFVASCDNDDDNDNTTPQLNQSDKDFLTKFTQSNLGGIKINQLGRDSGTDAQIANYSPMLIQDLQAGQKRLDSIASRFSFTLPTTGDSSAVAFYNTLNTTARGATFDSLFIANEIAWQDALLVELNKASNQATQSDLKNYAIQAIPIITRYRATADSIRLHL